MASRRRVALGFKTRTGRAIVVVLGGTAEAPEILAKVRVDVATTFDEGAVFHVAQGLPIDEARALIDRSEAAFVERARASLERLVDDLGATVIAAGMVAPPVKRLPRLEAILKAHPLLHAAEGELYRRVFTGAGAALGPRPTRIAPEELVVRAVDALGLTNATVTSKLAAIGKASGRPWTADHKDAALAAWLVLAEA